MFLINPTILHNFLGTYMEDVPLLRISNSCLSICINTGEYFFMGNFKIRGFYSCCESLNIHSFDYGSWSHWYDKLFVYNHRDCHISFCQVILIYFQKFQNKFPVFSSSIHLFGLYRYFKTFFRLTVVKVKIATIRNFACWVRRFY